MTPPITHKTFINRLTPLAQIDEADQYWLERHGLDQDTIENTIKGFDENGIEAIHQAALDILDEKGIDLSTQAREILENVTVTCDELIAI